MYMRVAIDREMLRQAMALGGHATQKAAVHDALTEYVARRKNASLDEMPWACDDSFRDDWDNPQDAEYDKFRDQK